MLERAISVAGLINTLWFAVCITGAYQQTMFVQEWLEVHARPEGYLRRQMLSVTAIFSQSVTERCRHRRRLVLMWTSAFFVLLAVQGLLVRF